MTNYEEGNIRNDGPSVDIIYQEICQNWRTCVEWRYWIIGRLFVAISALALFAKWLIVIKSHRVVFVPILISSLCFLLASLMESRNAKFVDITRETAKYLESLTSAKTGFFMEYPLREGSGRSYAGILRYVYLTGFCTTVVATMFFFFKYESWKIVTQ